MSERLFHGLDTPHVVSLMNLADQNTMHQKDSEIRGIMLGSVISHRGWPWRPTIDGLLWIVYAIEPDRIHVVSINGHFWIGSECHRTIRVESLHEYSIIDLLSLCNHSDINSWCDMCIASIPNDFSEEVRSDAINWLNNMRGDLIVSYGLPEFMSKLSN